MNPFFAFIRSLFDSLWACCQYLLVMLLVSFLLSWLAEVVKSKLFNTQEDDNGSSKPLVIFTLIQMAILIMLVFPDRYSEYTSPSYIRWNLADRYEEQFPETWAYIVKYSDDPYDYIEYYDEVWGDLQRYNGDGIVFDTLSAYEQSKVNYPSIGQYIYFAVGEGTYHSTKDCYTLLRSETSLRKASYAYLYTPCSKCVGK